MARELRSLLGYLALPLLLIGVAELAVVLLDVPRLWALLASFTLGYVIFGMVRSRVRATRSTTADPSD
ncbi:hypothetical protein ACTXJK_15245 [Brachybacterium tyrofermentans]|uniref:hypothetical protein n=1 Tax=Brachybacterium tyrofermentans TaxID=47848 RepID=UPI003FD0EB9F